jgi:hypothetical protein
MLPAIAMVGSPEAMWMRTVKVEVVCGAGVPLGTISKASVRVVSPTVAAL